MGTIVIEKSIDRPPEVVFAYLRDYSNQAVWQAEHVKEVIVEPPGLAQVGTRFIKVRRTPIGEQRFTEEVTEMNEEAMRWTEVILTGPPRGSTGSWHVLPDADGSRVRISIEPHAQGLWRLILPLISRTMRNDFRADFENLKEILEAPATD